MRNLLEETVAVLKEQGMAPEDVAWVGSADGKFAINWEEFKEISNFEYDNGFGVQEIASDLVIVGKDWWLERHEYDGSEWWEFKRQPKRQNEYSPFRNLMMDDYGFGDSLIKINKAR